MHIQNSAKNKGRQGSLTVVAIIFTGILLTCLIFQCVSYNKEISTIYEITQSYRNKRMVNHQSHLKPPAKSHQAERD